MFEGGTALRAHIEEKELFFEVNYWKDICPGVDESTFGGAFIC